MPAYHFVAVSANRKTGPIPVTYSERDTCPPSCPHYRADCYAEDYYTRMTWDKVPARGGSLADLCASITALPAGQLWRMNVAGDLPGSGEDLDPAALGDIVRANIGRKGFTYTHKKGADALYWAGQATSWGFTVNLSADDAGEADALADVSDCPITCIVPIDTPPKTYTPDGRTIIVCPAQVRDDITCQSCGLCAIADRAVIIGFRAHGTRAAVTDAKARRVIPIVKG
jgi:hypothetical protein